jgi:ABC-type amino acid transport substrate-binding protein
LVPDVKGLVFGDREHIAWEAQSSVADPVRIAHDLGFPPFAEVKDGKSEGLAVDILRAAAARAGVEVKFVPVPFDQRQLTLEDGRAEAYFPLSITPERLQLFDFTDVLVVTGGSIFVRAPNVPPASLAALADKIVVTPRSGPIAAFIQKTAPAVKLVVTTDYEDSLGRLVRDEASAAVLSYHVGPLIADQLCPGQVIRSSNMFLELPLAVAVPKGKRPELLTRLNAGIAEIRADGTWQQINDQWMKE